MQIDFKISGDRVGRAKYLKLFTNKLFGLFALIVNRIYFCKFSCIYCEPRYDLFSPPPVKNPIIGAQHKYPRIPYHLPAM
jgi:hypothetical protein